MDERGRGAARTRPDGDVLVSIVVPLYNEEEVIELFHQSLSGVLESAGYDFEVVMVDDGSRDSTRALAEALHARDPRIKLVALSRNHGHQLALTAGLEFARGDVAITMDGDLQHPPDLLPQMLDEWRKGAEIVQMLKEVQQGRGIVKSLAADIFYRLFRRIAEVQLDQNASDFRLLGEKALHAIRSIRERERFLRGLTSWIGFKRVDVHYVAPPRAAGAPKYTLGKLRRLALAGIFSFSTVPLTLAIYIGFTLAFFALLYGAHAFAKKLFGYDVPAGFTDIFVALTGLAGVQLVFLGIIGTYVGKIFQEVKQRPLFIVDEIVGFDDGNQAPTERNLRTSG